MPLIKGAKPNTKGFKKNIEAEMEALFSKSMINVFKVF